MSSALRVSVAANVVLIGVVAALLWSRGSHSSPGGIAGATDPAVLADPAPSPRVPASAPQPDRGTTAAGPAALAHLEQLGISREVFVNAVLGEFHRRWDHRFAELERKYAPRPVPEREYIELGRIRDAEQARALQAALGEDGYLQWDRERTLAMLNAGGIRLTPAEAEQAYRLQKEFDEQYQALQMGMEDGVADVADMRTLSDQARAELDRQLEQLLGAERYQAMRGVADPVADVYREFGDLNPTRDQAQAVLRADEDFRSREADLKRRLKDSASNPLDAAAELRAIQEARENQLREAFGAEAYETTRRQNDPTYRQITQFADAWELREHEVLPLYEQLRALHDHVERARAAGALRESAGQRVDWNEINASIERARQETEAGLQTLIGPGRLARLKDNGMLNSR